MVDWTTLIYVEKWKTNEPKCWNKKIFILGSNKCWNRNSIKKKQKFAKLFNFLSFYSKTQNSDNNTNPIWYFCLLCCGNNLHLSLLWSDNTAGNDLHLVFGNFSLFFTPITSQQKKMMHLKLPLSTVKIFTLSE